MSKTPDLLYPAGAVFAEFEAITRPVIAFADGRRFDFISSDKIAAANRAGGERTAQAFWQLMLQLSHCAALVALTRHMRWHNACVGLRRQPAYLPFMASLVGLTQSALDVTTGLGPVAPAFAKEHRHIRRNLIGKTADPVVMPELADLLSQFLHINTGRPVQPVALPNPELEAITPAMSALYAKFQELQIPGAGSTLAFQQLHHPTSVSLQTADDAQAIDDICREHAAPIQFAFMSGVTAPLVILKALNQFSMESVHTPAVDELPLDEAPSWQVLRGMFEE